MTLTLALAALILLTFPLLARATTKANGPSLQYRTSRAIVATWQCSDKIGQPRARARSPWTPHSTGYRRAELNRWTLRKQACLRTLHAHDDVLRRLRRGLTGTPMAGSEGALEAAGRRYRISPFFIAAIAGTESSFGEAACSGNPRNGFGLSSCNTGWHVPYFPTWASAYDFMGRFLTERWPSARTTYDYSGYAANSQAWGAKCAYWMRERFGVGPEVRYSP
jgi:hypothetical protein